MSGLPTDPVPSHDAPLPPEFGDGLPRAITQLADVPAEKGEVHLVHLYPREMSIYGDLGNTRCLAARLRWHGYRPVVHDHHPGAPWPERVDLVLGGGGQDSGQARVQDDLATHGDRLRELAADGVPMLMICGMYQLFGEAFLTVEGTRLPGLGILAVTTTGNATRMIGPVVLDTGFGEVVGYENHSGSTVLAAGQEPFGRVRVGSGNNGADGTEGARSGNVVGSYLHGPVLPANPGLADGLLQIAARRATGDFVPEPVDDTLARQAHDRQVRRLLQAGQSGSGRSRRLPSWVPRPSVRTSTAGG
ncbi:MAG TPA: cobalamin biosynthesis protein CobB [Ornithinimicrobium sp.]|nr:cobalamin biosynthesis protein CobB [Ornithinimicrobium sp.]